MKAASPPAMINRATILSWFSGKALLEATRALDLLAASEAAGYWLPNSSRFVRSRLTKQAVARKLAGTAPGTPSALYEMRNGNFMHAPKILATKEPADVTRWARDFAPLAELVALLDSRRPKPVIVCKTLSPSVVTHLSGKLGLALTSVEIPPSKGEWRDVTRPIKGDRYGRTETVKIWHVEIIWPAGIRHGRSCFGTSNAGNAQCEACGHAIRDPYNWCPLVAREADGEPTSLWVGKDCARKLLECEVDGGEAIYEGRVTA